MTWFKETLRKGMAHGKTKLCGSMALPSVSEHGIVVARRGRALTGR